MDFRRKEWEENSLVWKIYYMYNIRDEAANNGKIVATFRFSNARPCLPLIKNVLQKYGNIIGWGFFFGLLILFVSFSLDEK